MATQEEILAKSEQLQERLRALGGQPPTPQEEQAILKELLEIRILELSNTLPQKEAIEQAYNEQLHYKELAKSEESIKQFDLLEKIKNELLQAQIQLEAQESPEEKKKREKEEEEKDKKKDNRAGKNPLDGGGDYGVSGGAQAGSDQTNYAQCQIAFINTFSQSRRGTDPDNHTSPEVGKTGNSTTLDIGGIKATIYKSGVHREMKLELPPNPTDEQKERFNAALEKHKEYSNRGDYSLLSHNCVGAVAETLNSLAPDKFDASTRMPWSLDNQIQNELNQQLQQENTQSIGQRVQQWIKDAKNSLTNAFKQTPSPDQNQDQNQDRNTEMSVKKPSSDEKNEPAKADGKNITDANGEKQDVKKAEQEKEEQQKEAATAPTPRPPAPGQQSG